LKKYISKIFFLLILTGILLSAGFACDAEPPGGRDKMTDAASDETADEAADDGNKPQYPARPRDLPEWTHDYDGLPKPMEGKAMGFIYDRDTLTYELVWSDEFDYEGLPDPVKWGYDTGGHGWGNNELQYYTNDGNARVEGGRLIIEGRAEEMGGREYTSARLVTRNKGDWLYGKIEVSAKIPSGLGTWPAIWMLPTDWVYGGWPDSGEIDIMEHVGFDQNNIHASVHTKAFHHSINTHKSNGGVRISGVSDEFKVYSIEWLPDRIFFFIDGEQVYEYDPSRYVTEVNYTHWPYDKRFHLLINIALGGNWGGARGFDNDMLPVTMEVEYVRVYQSPEINALINN